MLEIIGPIGVVVVVAFLYLRLAKERSGWGPVIDAYKTDLKPSETYSDRKFLAGGTRGKARMGALPEGAYIRFGTFQAVLIPWSELELDGESLGARIKMKVLKPPATFEWYFKYHDQLVDSVSEQAEVEHLMRAARL
jgi:hypothetical protein